MARPITADSASHNMTSDDADAIVACLRFRRRRYRAASTVAGRAGAGRSDSANASVVFSDSTAR